MKIWIDLTNSPHVTFFSPIIQRLEKAGHDIVITYRDFAQTKSMVEGARLEATLIDGHGGKSKLGKIKSLLSRTYQLVKFAKQYDFDLAVSHNSYFQLLAAKYLGIKSLTSMDFEGQPANHIAFRLATLVSVPTSFPEADLKRFGAKNVAFYRGIKENISLANFRVERDFSSKLKTAFKLDDNALSKPIIVVRPPPVLALYHNNDEHIFQLVLEKLNTDQNTVLVVPRTHDQGSQIADKYASFHFSEQVLDGLQLVYFADAVISGGGSMNREAACLGTQAISVFSDALCAIDQHLQSQGMLQQLLSRDDIENLEFSKREKVYYEVNPEPINDFIGHINKLFKVK